MSNLIDECLFCKIIRGEIPSIKLHEDDKLVVFLDIYPLAEGHALIVPKYHGPRLHDIPDEYLVDILPLAKKIAIASGSKDYNILQNSGATAAQAAIHIPHVHFHVIPKPTEDVGLVIGGTQLKVEKEELIKVGEKLNLQL